MSPITHFLAGWMVANAGGLERRRERAAVALAGVLPDVDGLGIVAEVLTRDSARPLTWYSDYHHTFHNVFFALALAGASFAIATRRWKTAVLAFLSFHLHLLGDILGARGPDGYQWPIPYLLPFSRSLELQWSGQWELNAWPNFVITGALLLITFYLAWQRGYSPLEMLSCSADDTFVASLRSRIPIGQKAEG